MSDLLPPQGRTTSTARAVLALEVLLTAKTVVKTCETSRKNDKTVLTACEDSRKMLSQSPPPPGADEVDCACGLGAGGQAEVRFNAKTVVTSFYLPLKQS